MTQMRPPAPGPTCFFTLALAEAGSTALTDEIGLLRVVYASVAREHPVTCHAMVVLPDHLHGVWTLPRGDTDFQIRWHKLRTAFARHARARAGRAPSDLWQAGLHRRLIHGDAEQRRHVAYCWMDPVRHELVAQPADWPATSLHSAIRTGVVPENWSGPLTDLPPQRGPDVAATPQGRIANSPRAQLLIN